MHSEEDATHSEEDAMYSRVYCGLCRVTKKRHVREEKGLEEMQGTGAGVSDLRCK